MPTTRDGNLTDPSVADGEIPGVEDFPKSVLGRWLFIRRYVMIFGLFVFIGLCAIVVTFVIGARDAKRLQDEGKVADDWKQSIRSLQLIPVYPPSEEYYVGDLYANDAGSPDDDPTQSKSRSMKIAHLPKTSDVLRTEYKNLPHFPLTPEKYNGTSSVDGDVDVFRPQDVLKGLPIVALPAFFTTTNNDETIGGGVVTDLVASLLYSRSRKERVQMKISEAETYGLPAGKARELLNEFCNRKADTPNELCTDRVLRDLLSSVAGASVLCPRVRVNQDQGAAQKPAKRPHKIGLFLISRVYLTRSIDYEYGSDAAVSAAVQAKLDHSGVPPDPTTGRNAPPTEPPQSPTNEPNDGGRVTVTRTAANGSNLKTIFARPVVIGYQALWQDPIDDGCVWQASDTGSKAN